MRSEVSSRPGGLGARFEVGGRRWKGRVDEVRSGVLEGRSLRDGEVQGSTVRRLSQCAIGHR